jgi:1,4-dihydroxy-6-naphthoate synthase
MTLSIAVSPCPNDCFMIDAIVNRRIDLEGFEFSLELADVETLNRAAFEGRAEVTKLSYHAYAYCADRYVALNAGSALGRNCGPLLISKRDISPEEVARGQLRIAIPGKYTTANLLLGLAFPAAQRTSERVFSEIESAVLDEEVDAGVIIHENRFTYEARGLKKIIDLGEYWEGRTGHPLPLGAIVVKRALPDEVKRAIDRVLRRSVEYAFANPSASLPFVRANAQEMDESVVYRHIDLYVNQFSVDLGDEGREAVRTLFAKGVESGVVPEVRNSLFVA